jgi:hypothetical protein
MSKTVWLSTLLHCCQAKSFFFRGVCAFLDVDHRLQSPCIVLTCLPEGPLPLMSDFLDMGHSSQPPSIVLTCLARGAFTTGVRQEIGSISPLHTIKTFGGGGGGVVACGFDLCRILGPTECKVLCCRAVFERLEWTAQCVPVATPAAGQPEAAGQGAYGGHISVGLHL